MSGDQEFGGFAPPQPQGGIEPPRFDSALAPAPEPASPQWPPPPGAPAVSSAKDGGAMGSLILGIGGLAAFVLTGFGLLFFINLPASIAAWVMGRRARLAHDRGETLGHEERARWGMVLGIIGTVLGVLAVILWAIAIALSQEVRDELQRQFEES